MSSENQTSQFMGWSLLIHTAFVLATLIYQVPPSILPSKNIVIEIVEPKPFIRKETPVVKQLDQTQAQHSEIRVPTLQKMKAQNSVQPDVDNFSEELSNVLQNANNNSIESNTTPSAAELDVPELAKINAKDIQTAHLNTSDLVNESEYSVITSKNQAQVQKLGAGFDKSINAAKSETDKIISAQSEALKNEASKRGQYLAQRKNQIGAELGSALAKARTLDQLRQMPNNPKPSYSEEERLLGHQGQIVFLAFINKEGSVSDFKLMRSTGHKNLDLKTFAALKKWRFYPGQEGWVELPYVWNLKGGTQEMPTLLRREISKK